MATLGRNPMEYLKRICITNLVKLTTSTVYMLTAWSKGCDHWPFSCTFGTKRVPQSKPVNALLWLQVHVISSNYVLLFETSRSSQPIHQRQPISFFILLILRVPQSEPEGSDLWQYVWYDFKHPLINSFFITYVISSNKFYFRLSDQANQVPSKPPVSFLFY